MFQSSLTSLFAMHPGPKVQMSRRADRRGDVSGFLFVPDEGHRHCRFALQVKGVIDDSDLGSAEGVQNVQCIRTLTRIAAHTRVRLLCIVSTNAHKHAKMQRRSKQKVEEDL